MTAQKWLSIFGSVDIADGVITHIPVYPASSTEAAPTADGAPRQPPHAIIRSNIEFEQGSISWEARLGEESERVQLMLSAEPKSPGDTASSQGDAGGGSELSAGLNVLGVPYGFGIWSGKWDGAGGAGHGSKLPANQWLHVKVTVRGSVIELYVEDVKVASTNWTLKRGPISFLLQGTVGATIRNVAVTKDKPVCFVVMQFTEEFNVLYKDVIYPVCEDYGYKVLRGDDFYTSGLIMDDVTQSIQSSALIIADVTPDNANVFYEVGYAHAINKPTILLSDRKRERLPFDISGFRTLFYDNTIGGKALVEARLRQHLDALRST